MEKRRSFGSYLREKRLEKGITMRTVCEALKVSLPYMSDVENDRRNPLDKDKLDQLMGILCLSREEQQELYDLAGRGRDTVSPDLQEYIMDTDAVRIALRTARDADISADEWLRFAEMIQKKHRRE